MILSFSGMFFFGSVGQLLQAFLHNPTAAYMHTVQTVLQGRNHRWYFFRDCKASHRTLQCWVASVLNFDYVIFLLALWPWNSKKNKMMYPFSLHGCLHTCPLGWCPSFPYGLHWRERRLGVCKESGWARFIWYFSLLISHFFSIKKIIDPLTPCTS